MKDNNLAKGHRSRLKERYSELFKGDNISFQEYEFLELLLIYAIPRKDVKPLAKRLLSKYKSIENIINLDYVALQKEKGIGQSTAIFLKSLGVLIKMVMEKKLKDDTVFSSMIEIHSKTYLVNYLRSDIGHLNQEIFEVLFLNSSNKLVGVEKLFFGTIDRSAVYPRIIMEKIFEYGASGVIFAHNHPSGNISPSKADIRLTRDMKENLRKIDVTLFDHIIISKNSYFSFFEENLI